MFFLALFLFDKLYIVVGFVNEGRAVGHNVGGPIGTYSDYASGKFSAGRAASKPAYTCIDSQTSIGLCVKCNLFLGEAKRYILEFAFGVVDRHGGSVGPPDTRSA